ncbi:MAG: HK97-gp10 family putative phage morphogenesis protein [Pseudomonadota bacterium]|nr:HK97-gp10 family putative phage morphogenesis protein [Pseudomonadota bacterium]
MPIKFRGADKHLRRLKAMGPRAEREASKLVLTLADMHAKEASYLITQGSVGGANHVPSLPGEPPNADTGHLHTSIHAESAGPLKAVSVADADYSAALEFGTSKMAERPFMRPAAKTVRREAEVLAKAAAKRITKGGTI